jgi:hypothetical protein
MASGSLSLQLGEAGGCVLCLPNLPNEIFVALISSGLNLCCPYFIGVKSLLHLFHRGVADLTGINFFSPCAKAVAEPIPEVAPVTIQTFRSIGFAESVILMLLLLAYSILFW